MVTQPEFDTRAAEPPQPGAQQRRGLERLREHAAACADERRLAQAFAPGTHLGRRKRLDRRTQMRHGRAVAREEALELFAVRQVEPATAGQQELPAGRRHPVIDRDARAAAGQQLRRHQAGRAAADHGDLKISHLRRF
jgi:hypothetical protein